MIAGKAVGEEAFVIVVRFQKRPHDEWITGSLPCHPFSEGCEHRRVGAVDFVVDIPDFIERCVPQTFPGRFEMAPTEA